MAAITIMKQLDLISPLPLPPPPPTSVCWGGWFTHSFIACMTVSSSCYCRHRLTFAWQTRPRQDSASLRADLLVCQDQASRFSLVAARSRRVENKQACNWITHSSHSERSGFKFPLLFLQPDLAPPPHFRFSHQLLSSVGHRDASPLGSCSPTSSRRPVTEISGSKVQSGSRSAEIDTG